MKRITTLLALACVSSFTFAQSQRMTLLEEFTQASCGPCASQNPALNTLLNANTTKVIDIKYQTSWPGVDPMNAQTQSDVGPRVSYYGVTGVPNIRFDGNVTTGAPSALTQTIIDNEYAVVSPFTLSMSHNFSPDYDSIFISAVITCTQNVTMTTARFRCAMVEETITFAQPPGTNGETVFYGVMRKMYPNATGTTIANSWTVGQTQTITFSAPVPSYIYDPNQIAIVGFIQDDQNRNVKQAGLSPAQPLTNNSSVTALTNVPFVTCTGTFTPTATIKNLGTATMTSCTINMQIDNNTPTTTPWTGSLASNATANVVLPAQTVPAGSHTFKVWTTNPNGQPVGFTVNASQTKTIVNNSTPMMAPLVQGFQSTPFVPTGWALDNPDNGPTWTRVTTCGGFGNSTASAKMDFYNSTSGNVDQLYCAAVDLSTATSASLTFNLAYRQYSNENDRLEVKVSTDCGQTWATPYNKAGTTLTTVTPGTTSPFTPSATQWRAETVNMNAYAGQSNVLVKFVATSNYGNNLYIDDINLSGTTSVGELESSIALNVYPNPVSGNATVSISLANTEKVSVQVYNLVGELVYTANAGELSAGNHNISLNSTNLSNGVYFVKVTAGANNATRKITVNN